MKQHARGIAAEIEMALAGHLRGSWPARWCSRPVEAAEVRPVRKPTPKPRTEESTSRGGGEESQPANRSSRGPTRT